MEKLIHSGKYLDAFNIRWVSPSHHFVWQKTHLGFALISLSFNDNNHFDSDFHICNIIWRTEWNKHMYFGIKHWNRQTNMSHQMELLFCPQTNWPVRVLEYKSCNPFVLLWYSFWALVPLLYKPMITFDFWRQNVLNLNDWCSKGIDGEAIYILFKKGSILNRKDQY